MPITKVAGFAHLASDGNTGSYASGHSFVQSEYQVASGRVGSATPFCYVPSNGRMAFGKSALNGSGQAHGISSFALAPMFGGLDPATFKKFILCFRMETRNPGMLASMPLIGFTFNDVINASGTGYDAGDPILLTLSPGFTPAITLVELVFDLVAKTVAFYQDGSLVTTIALVDKYITGFANLKMFAGRKDTMIANPTSNGTTNYFAYFDNMYAVADTGDTSDPYRDRQGAMLVERIKVTAVDGTWVPSTGTNLSVINTARSDDASANQTPVTVSPGDNSGLAVTLDMSGYSDKRPLVGMSVSVGSFKGASETGALDAQLTSAGGDLDKTEVASPNLASTSVVARLQGVKALTRLPSAANLGSLKLKLLPR